MASSFDKYRFRQTALTDEVFNRIWRDLDKRLDLLELLGFRFTQQEQALIAEALSRINEEIQPVVEQIAGFAHLGDLLTCKSATALTIGTGSKTFIVDEADRDTFAAPLFIIASSIADPTKWMAGQVATWDRATGQLIVAMTNTRGSRTVSDWRISVTSIPPEAPPAQDAEDITVAAIANLSATNVQAAIAEHQGDIDALNVSLAAKAPLASPALTGTPTAPTPTSTDNTTKIATTAFVKA